MEAIKANIGMTIRYVVAAIGAGLVGFGYATSEGIADLVTQVDSLIAAIAAIGAFGYALVNKIKNGKDA